MKQLALFCVLVLIIPGCPPQGTPAKTAAAIAAPRADHASVPTQHHITK